jgi:hypothetical protein
MPAISATANPVPASRAFAALFQLDCILIPPSRLEDDVESMLIHVRVSRTAKIRWSETGRRSYAHTAEEAGARTCYLLSRRMRFHDIRAAELLPKRCQMNVKTRRWKDGTGRVGRKRARSSRLALEPTEDQHVAGRRGSNSRRPFSRSATRVETPEDKSLRNGVRPPSTATA